MHDGINGPYIPSNCRRPEPPKEPKEGGILELIFGIIAMGALVWIGYHFVAGTL